MLLRPNNKYLVANEYGIQQAQFSVVQKPLLLILRQKRHPDLAWSHETLYGCHEAFRKDPPWTTQRNEKTKKDVRPVGLWNLKLKIWWYSSVINLSLMRNIHYIWPLLCDPGKPGQPCAYWRNRYETDKIYFGQKNRRKPHLPDLDDSVSSLRKQNLIRQTIWGANLYKVKYVSPVESMMWKRFPIWIVREDGC